MNKIRLSAYMMAFMAAGFSGCTNDVEMPVDSKGTQTVMMTVDVSRSADDTRSSLSQVDDDLACVWTEDDKLLVTSTDGSRLGVLTIKSINSEDRSKATFSGKLENVADGKNVTVNYIYLGNKGDYTTVPTNNVYAADYSEQDGTIKSLSDHDIMTKQAQAIIENGYSYVDGLVMERRVSFARFKLNLPDGVTFDGNTSITVTGDGVNNSLSVNGGSLEAAYTAGSVAITPSSNDFYMTLLPNTLSSGFDLTFTVSTTDAAYTGVYQVSKTIAQGKFYRKDNSGNPIEVTLTKVPKTYNPGDMSSWGGVGMLIEPKYTDTKDTSKKYRDGGWCNNDYSLYLEGGWCDPIIYHSNGIVNGALYSTRVASPSYFQWGRWMGFPYNDNMLIINSYGQPVNNYWAADNAFALGESIKDNGTVRYQNTQHGSVYGGYFALMATTWWLPKGWDNSMAIKASVIFAGAESQPSSSWQDYLNTNENCTWENRAGNPCPDGWRIPTMNELKALIPGGKTTFKIEGSHAEVRSVNGEKYAFCYKIDTNNEGVPCLNIVSVKTNKDNVNVNDPIFNNTQIVSIGAYGIINYEGAREYYKTRAYVWSSESGTGGNFSGYAGAALRIIFSGNSATISYTLSDRINGATVIPIRDDNAKHTDIRPWFPHFTY